MTQVQTFSQLQILGFAHVLNPEREPWRLERKTAGLLAYLALEGATSRSKLAGLLWPQSQEGTARNNLRQMIRRVREGSGVALFAGDDPLTLTPDLMADAARLELEFFAGHFQEVVSFGGELLSGHDYEDCTEFTEWLLAQREHLTALRRDALNQLIEHAERTGDHRSALMHAESLLEMNPISEVAHRNAMRLLYLLGDRGAALRAFERCRAVLTRELGVEPLPETTALARQIEAGEHVATPTAPARREIPLSVQRPPRLVGRSREWTALETAWDAGLGVLVGGEPGVGKTRLALEFVTQKGAFTLIEGRPGDENLPYSTLARGLRTTLMNHPELMLEVWVRRELSRLIPSFELDAPPPITSDAERLRFFEAVASVYEESIRRGVLVLVIDDLQFVDAASFEAVQYIISRFESLTGPHLRSLFTFRTNELRPETDAVMQQRLSAGQVALIEVRRLGEDALLDLLSAIGIPGLSELGPALGRHTGGNPLFILETLRSLIESGDLERGLTARLPVPERLGSLVARRLERLTPAAQRLARTVAVAGTDFDLELGARVLESHVVDLSAPWAELEAAQVVSGAGFAHDLLAEAALKSVPAPIRVLLHKRIAGHMESVKAEPARVAHHWLEATEELRAAPPLIAAGKSARNRFRLEDAARFQEHAASILERHARRDEEFAALLELCESLMQFDFSQRHERVTERLLQLAISPLERAKARHVRAELLNMLERASDALTVACEGLREAKIAGAEHLQAQLHGDIGVALWTLERLDEAHTELARALEFTERGDDPVETAVAVTNLAVVLDHLDRHREAIGLHHRAVRLFEQNDERMHLATALSNLAISMADLGTIRDSLPVLRRAIAIFDDLQGADVHYFAALLSLACAERDANQYAQAIDHFQQGLALAERSGDPRSLYLRAHLSRIYRELGALELAFEHAHAASHNPNARSQQQGVALLEQARCLEALGQPFEAVLKEAEGLLKKSGRYLLQRVGALEAARSAPSKSGLKIALEVSRQALERELFSLALNALTRVTQHQLALKQFPQALETSSQAMSLLETYDPDHLYRAEVFGAHFRALEANQHPETQAHLQRTLNWLLETADHHVPPEFRDSFMTRNSVNRAILEAAARFGLEMH
jgi:DNA-binding SARP family transcriptional activator/tetratricopeptide (TPR) repeat protein